MSTNLVDIFYIIDEFCKEIEKTMEGHRLTSDNAKRHVKEHLRCPTVK